MTLHEPTPNTSQRYMEVTGKIVRITGHECPEGDRGIDPLILNLDAKRGGWATQRTGRFIPGKEPVPTE